MILVSWADPCSHAKCQHGEVCVLDGQRPRCLCPPRCLDRRVQQKCGTDGITYKNDCELLRTACIIGDITLKKKHDGRCGSKPVMTGPPVSSSTTAQPITKIIGNTNLCYQSFALSCFWLIFLPLVAKCHARLTNQVWATSMSMLYVKTKFGLKWISFFS